MSTAKYYVGDVFDVLATLEPASVDLVMTSPPFLALRSYLPADHPDKAREIGSEATPGAFIDRMLDVVEACARVLAPHGSLVIELGDTYAGSGGAGGDYDVAGLRDGQPRWNGSSNRRSQDRTNHVGGAGWPLDKSKVLIPQLFAIALAYGFNPLTGRQTEPWRVRNTVAWCRPNPPVGRDGDKFRPATSFLTVACKARDRYWDGDAVRTEYENERQQRFGGTRKLKTSVEAEQRHITPNPAGAPLLDWWSIPTHPYKNSHYATYPPALVVPIIKSMCPAKVCRVCGEPSRRITGETTYRTDDAHKSHVEHFTEGERVAEGVNRFASAGGNAGCVAERETLGWSDCGHGAENMRNGMVLDPFAGSGTTLQVATGHGRDAIGIDLDARNADLAVERIGGLFLTVERFAFPIGEVS